MNLKQQAVKGVAWSALASWGGQATQFLTFLILARLLTPDAFGLVSLSNIFIHLVQALISNGFSEAIVQRKAVEPQHLNTAFWVNLGISLLLVAIGCGTAGWVAAGFRQPELAPVIQWLSLNVLINAFSSVQDALLRRKLAFKELAGRQLVGLVIGSVVGILLAGLGCGVWSLVSQSLITNLIGGLFLWQVSGWRPGWQISWQHFQDLFAFGINVIGINILTFLTLRSDDFLIGYFLGSTALGYYTVAYKLLVTVTQLLYETIGHVSMPTFASLQSDRQRLQNAFQVTTGFISLVGVPLFAGAAVLAPELVLTLFGEVWQPSVPVMQILAMVGMVRIMTCLHGQVIMAIGQPSLELKLAALGTGLRVFAFLIAARGGIVQVALALLLCEICITLIRFFVFSRVTQIHLFTYWQRYLMPGIGAIVMVAIVWLAKSFLVIWLPILILLIGCVLVGALTYLATIALAFPQLFSEAYELATSSFKRR